MAENASNTWRDDKAAKLLEAMLRGSIPEAKPQLNPQSELGFSFPTVSQPLQTGDRESLALLDSLAAEGILVKRFSDKFLYCPRCRSMNIRPAYCCPKCGAGNIARRTVLEHLVCHYVGTEDEFFVKGRLICPKCAQELHTPASDYRSLGVQYKCRDCSEIFSQPAIKWRCLKCASITPGEKIGEVDAYSYSINEERRNWIEFELKPRAQLSQSLRNRGYEVRQNARLKGMSGAEHSIDILATRDDHIVVHNIAIGIEIADKPVGLNKVFSFDSKAYDIGLYDKVLIAIPELTPEARQFAARQRIRVLESADLETFLGSISAGPPQEVEARVETEPFQFQSRSRLVSYLQTQGYEIKEATTLKGRSGAQHTIDILATRDAGVVMHSIIIGTEVSAQPIAIDRVFDFDDKAYDAGIRHKILLAVPGLSREAMSFAHRQGIRVFETAELEPGAGGHNA
jgi:hypothetical protein